ncbi:GRAM domain-containing protein [Boletus edulis BED1]|uniref:GRAM domain-containing protein n=1 Tax=Boletus edulis BED1 TaxID=1328754 RepID=A0AAD4GBF6_BOLED|nr:GRAM domain-containing protein [Boletus edulis BED1]
MSQTPLVPPLSPLPPPVPASKSSLSVNGTKPDATPTRHAVASIRSSARTRSPHISRSRSDFSDGDAYASSGDESGSSSDELDLTERDIPVTGFAVASSKRNADFHELFPSIPEGDYLIEDYGCALQREILIQGRLYISENHICFHANIFGWITDLSIPIYEITGLEKKMTAFVIPNAIQITTRQAKYTFASFLSRDTTYDVINNIWRLARPDDTFELSDSHNTSTRDMASFTTSVSEGSGKESAVAGADKVTHCACSKSGGHLNDLALETVLPGTPEKIYNLMFASGFMKDFMKVDQRLIDVQISDWAPVDQTSKLLQRNMSYIKPLNNSVGPRQTKCEIHDEAVHCDFDDSMVMVTSTKTPDVPSGGVFVVRTRTCLMWASSISTRVIVTTQVEWTGRSFIKGLIEKSAIEGQKVYHSDLDKAMRMYIQEHQAEFVPEGLDLAAVAPVEPITPLAEANGGPEAPLSAVEARKAREHDRNRRGMQWAYDTLEGAYCVAERSTKGALELVKEAWEQSSSTTILWFVIVLLVFVNMWTLMLVGNREEVGRRKEMKRAEEKERWLQGVVAGVWEELGAERARAAGGGVSVPLTSVPVGDVQAEVANVGKMLDAVEQRVRTIRESLAGLS